ncbi:MAG: PepSY-like domain-containing protein [Parafilimonas sp.]
MKKLLGLAAVLFIIHTGISAQEKDERNEKVNVPTAVKNALVKKYPEATHVTWEKENGNYEANWGGKSGEDNSVQFTPAGNFIEIVKAISVSELPANVSTYVKSHYNGAKITEAGKVTDAKGKLSYEAEVHGKDVIFDENGNFVKSE